jgi:hypothetical protein
VSGHGEDVAALVSRLNGFCREHAWPLRMPAGVRLECHMSVLAALHALPPDPDAFTSSLATVGDPLKTRIPVMVTGGMGRGGWRLAADGGTIDEGTIREAER